MANCGESVRSTLLRFCAALGRRSYSRSGSTSVPEISAGPLAGPLCLHSGERTNCWSITDPTRVPPLDPRYLDSVKDSATLPFNIEKPGVTEKEQKEQAEKLRESFAYWDAVIKANRTP